MKKNLTIEDFEVVHELEPMNGCSHCWFLQESQCKSVMLPVGIALENKYGQCTEGHHYKLINNN